MRGTNSHNREKNIDQIDCQMIELLQKDARTSNTEMA